MLLDGEARLAHGLDLLQELLRPLFDAVVGDFLVVEDHQLANGALAGLERVAHANHRLGDGGHARDRLDHRELAALDAAGDFHFAFARQQRHGAHLAQVHADGIVGLVERTGREVELGALAFGTLVTLDALALELVALLRVDQLDAGAGKHREQFLEVFGVGRQVGRQQVIDFVVQEITFLLADDNELTDFIEFLFERQGHIACDPQNQVCRDNPC